MAETLLTTQLKIRVRLTTDFSDPLQPWLKRGPENSDDSFFLNRSYFCRIFFSLGPAGTCSTVTLPPGNPKFLLPCHNNISIALRHHG